jgi:hypothetical protein
MRKFYFSLITAVLLTCFLNQASAQNLEEIVVVRKSFGHVYFLSGRQLSKAELLYVLDSHSDARNELRKGYRNKLPAAILSYAGGFLIGYPIGNKIAGGDPNWEMGGIGAGLLGLSLPFTVAINKRELRAVSLYNAGLHQTLKPRYDLLLGYTPNGVSLRVIF